MHPLISVFGREISVYGLMAIAGAGIAALYVWLENRRRCTVHSVASDDLLNIACYCIVGVIVGAKLLGMLVAIPTVVGNWETLSQNTVHLVEAMLGGFVFYGGAIGGALAVVWYCRRYRVPVALAAGLLAPAIPLFHVFGRIGCFFAGCCWGVEVPWGIAFTHSLAAPNSVPLMPIQLIEAAGNAVLFLALAVLVRRLHRKWLTLPIYVLAYSVMRFVLECFRGDTARGVWLLSTSQWISAALFFGAAAFLVCVAKGKDVLPKKSKAPDVTVRLEQPKDYRAVESLTREAFWGHSGRPGCDEHLLAHNLRENASFVPELDYVAEVKGKAVGNVMFSRAAIITEAGESREVLTFGPLSVLPGDQRHGIGAALMKHTLAQAAALGYRAVIIYGEPDYYPRFGFERAGVYGITTDEGDNFDAFMALPLYPGALDGMAGRFVFDNVYLVDEAEAKEFDKQFPFKPAYRPVPIGVMVKALGASTADVFAGKKVETMEYLCRFSGREMASWPGIAPSMLPIINAILRAYRLPEKTWPE